MLRLEKDLKGQLDHLYTFWAMANVILWYGKLFYNSQFTLVDIRNRSMYLYVLFKHSKIALKNTKDSLFSPIFPLSYLQAKKKNRLSNIRKPKKKKRVKLTRMRLLAGN